MRLATRGQGGAKSQTKTYFAPDRLRNRLFWPLPNADSLGAEGLRTRIRPNCTPAQTIRWPALTSDYASPPSPLQESLSACIGSGQLVQPGRPDKGPRYQPTIGPVSPGTTITIRTSRSLLAFAFQSLLSKTLFQATIKHDSTVDRLLVFRNEEGDLLLNALQPADIRSPTKALLPLATGVEEKRGYSSECVEEGSRTDRRSMSNSPASTIPGFQSATMADSIDSLLDFSEYDNSNSYQSPSLSPVTTTKNSFAKPIKAEANPASLLPPSQPMNGPSHQYDQYKQQTGIVPGALASTLAVNQNNTHIQGYTNFNIDFMGMGNTDDAFDFNVDPSQTSLGSDIDMEFESPSADAGFFFTDAATINPSSIGAHEPAVQSPPVMPAQTSNVGRLWPGMHQQAALAKAQAQQRQQMLQQQRLAAHNQQPKQQQQQRPKNTQPTDPIVEQKITQLLNSMRAKPASPESSEGSPLVNVPRPRKDEEDMDEDERLLASDEGKKLSSKERRQLRNKVSARAFRSRRKGKRSHPHIPIQR